MDYHYIVYLLYNGLAYAQEYLSPNNRSKQSFQPLNNTAYCLIPISRPYSLRMSRVHRIREGVLRSLT